MARFPPGPCEGHEGIGRGGRRGKGDLAYDLYLKHLREAGYGGPLVMHGLTEEEVAGSLAFLRDKPVGAALGGAGAAREAGR
jgi:hypothetical protein